MADNFTEQGVLINSLVGSGTAFKGELSLSGLLRIDGDFSGAITTPGKVLVGRGGRVSARIVAGSVVIGGAVKGSVVASEKVLILSSGIFIGSITAPRLIVEEGVVFHGACRINKDEVPKALAESGVFPGPEPSWKP